MHAVWQRGREGREKRDESNTILPRENGSLLATRSSLQVVNSSKQGYPYTPQCFSEAVQSQFWDAGARQLRCRSSSGTVDTPPRRAGRIDKTEID